MMLLVLIFSFFTLTAQADVHVQSQCTFNEKVDISILKDFIQIDTSENHFKFAIPNDFLSLFESNYQGDTTFRDSENILLQPLRDDSYNYTLVLMETKNPSDKSLKIVIDSLETFEKENWWPLGTVTKEPKERFMYFVYLKSPNRTSRTAEIIYRQKEGAADTVKSKEVTCEITSYERPSELEIP